MRRSIPALACAVALVSLSVHAGGTADARGELGLALMLRKLATVGTVMHATAHPDDENNALMAKQSEGQGLRVVLATATRGNGGQNEIGPELFEALGVLRNEEMLAAHRFDGAEQFFTRAVDFGFSFSVEETFEKWGHDEILGDYVRLIRMTRPDVIITMRPEGAGVASTIRRRRESRPRPSGGGRSAGTPSSCSRAAPVAGAEGYQARWYGMFERDTPPPAENLVTVDGNGTTRCSDARGRRSAARRVPCTSARASASCSLCLDLRRQDKLVDTTLASQRDAQESTLEDGLDMTLPGLARFAGASR